MPGFNIQGSGRGLPSNKVETHRVHRWIIEDFGFPMQLTGGSSRTTTSPSPRVYAKTAQIPTVGFETQTAPGASVDYPYAAKATFEPVSISFYDIYGMYNLFDRWRKEIWTPEEGIKQLDGYVGDPKISKVDGQGNIVERFTLRNAFPKQLSQSDLTYDSSEISLVRVQYVYSHFEFDELLQAAAGF